MIMSELTRTKISRACQLTSSKSIMLTQTICQTLVKRIYWAPQSVAAPHPVLSYLHLPCDLYLLMLLQTLFVFYTILS